MIEALLLNLFAQAIWELALSPVLRGSEASLEGEEDPQQAAQTRQTRYGAAAQLAAERLASVEGLGASEAELCAFLETQEVKNLLRSLYMFRLDASAVQGVDEARQEFAALWERSDLRDLGNQVAQQVFDALLTAAEDTLASAVREGVLSAHESRSNARHQILIQRIDAMERRLHLLASGAGLDIAEVERFEAEFRREVRQRHAFITPPDFYSASRVEIDRLYVMPHLEPIARSSGSGSEEATVEEWLRSLHHAVVLGDPGGGKSTLAAKLCHALADDSAGWQVAGSVKTPVMVTLREYSAVNKDKGLSVVEYIEYVASSRCQLDVPDGAVEYLLLSGRLMVIFDGLDELLETHHRQQIRDDVESFQRRFPDAPLLVTSRSVGYEQAPLDEDVFEAARLAQFSDDQVAEYAHKWFSFDEDLVKADQIQKADAFIEESRSVPDLRVNPLMLALMCNFYRGQNYLPRHRPEVYEQCARMLFETWDRSRGIEQVLPIAEHIRPAMRYLAYWIYQDEDRQSGTTESALIDKAVDFLMEYRFDDEHEARHAAKAFIDFCAGRAWVFTDTGTTQDGEPLFQFTHRTFLEYFTADHLVATADNTAELSENLRSRIAAREWVVVAQVAYQLKARGTLAAPDQLLRDLVAHSSDGSSAERANLLLFASECLSFLVPSPPVVRSVAERVLEFAIEEFSGDMPDEVGAIVSALVPTLATASPETRRTVGSTVEEVLGEIIQPHSPRGVAGALAIYGFASGVGMGPEVFVDWREITERLKEETLGTRRELARGNVDLALAMANDRELMLAEIVEQHGTNCLFIGRPVPLQLHSYFGALADNMAGFSLQHDAVEMREKAWEILAECGETLPQYEPPWRDLSVGMAFGFPALFSRFGEEGDTSLPQDVLRGLTFVLAVKVEEQIASADERSAGTDRLRDSLNRTESGAVAALRPIFLQRLTGEPQEDGILQQLGFDEQQADLLTQWMDGECDLVTGEMADQ